MSKKDLLKIISRDSGLKLKKTAKIFNRVFELISKDIKKGRSVTIESFGEFKIKRQKLKITNNKNKSRVVVPPKDFIEFEFSEKINSVNNSNE